MIVAVVFYELHFHQIYKPIKLFERINNVGIFYTENFKLPEEGELFNNVSFVGVNKEEAEEIVKKYNKEGRDARPRDDRSYNRGFGGRDHMDRAQSYGRPPMGGFRQRCTFKIIDDSPSLRSITQLFTIVLCKFQGWIEDLRHRWEEEEAGHREVVWTECHRDIAIDVIGETGTRLFFQIYRTILL